jgi:ferredoxin
MNRSFRVGLSYDLVGVAPLSRFEGLPPAEHPRSLFPEGKSVVVLGRRLHRGRFRTLEEGTFWINPERWLADLDEAVRRVESYGYECVPYLPLSPPRIPARPIRAGLCAPNAVRLSIEFAAVCAGLGTIGYHGMFMSPRFGIRQSLGLLVTDMEIEPDPPETASNVCDGCMDCVRQCPMNAIAADRRRAIEVNGIRMTMGEINPEACRVCPNGACGDARQFAGAEEMHFKADDDGVKGGAPPARPSRGLPNRLAAACGRACISHFEAVKPTGYALPFRIREAWARRPDDNSGGQSC